MIHQNDDILYQAASVWENLTEYHYIITYGYKNKLHTLNLTFSPEDFPHLAGFQYLRDLSLPRYNPRKILSNILSQNINLKQLKKGHVSVHHNHQGRLSDFQPQRLILLRLPHPGPSS